MSRAPSATSIRPSDRLNPPRTKKTTPHTTSEGGVPRNPFLARSNSIVSPPPQPILPPLPPRKPSTVLPPPRHSAPPPPKPSSASMPSSTVSTTPHQVSNLIRQSLMAAKAAPKNPGNEFMTWEVIKSSAGPSLKDRVKIQTSESRKFGEAVTDSSISTTVHSRYTTSPPSSSSSTEHASTTSSRVPPPLPLKSRQASRSASPTKMFPVNSASPMGLSTADIDDVVTVNSSHSGNSPRSAYSILSSSPSPGGPTRPTRSKSLHGPSPSKPNLPPPPPSRKRPESVQVLAYPYNTATIRGPSPSSLTPPLSRHTSLHSKGSGHGHSHSHSLSSPEQRKEAFGAVSPTSTDSASVASNLYSSLEQKAKATEAVLQPGLEKFAWKTEGNLAPSRGYLSHRGVEGERLVTNYMDDNDDDNKNRKFAYPFADTKASPPNDGRPGMDIGEIDHVGADDTGGTSVDWTEWERSGREAMTRGRLASAGGGTGAASPSSQSQRTAVQMELDELRGRGGAQQTGWSRLSG